MNIIRIREIQLGLIILIVMFFSFLFSGIDLNMRYSHRFIIGLIFSILLLQLVNLAIIIQIPHRGLLVLTHKHDTWFLSTFKTIFFMIFFTVTAIFAGLVADALHMDRTQDILLLSMFVTDLYYLIVSLWVTYNFLTMSAMGENMDYE